jgi:hypothetical protein
MSAKTYSEWRYEWYASENSAPECYEVWDAAIQIGEDNNNKLKDEISATLDAYFSSVDDSPFESFKQLMDKLREISSVDERSD